MQAARVGGAESYTVVQGKVGLGDNDGGDRVGEGVDDDDEEDVTVWPLYSRMYQYQAGWCASPETGKKEQTPKQSMRSSR